MISFSIPLQFRLSFFDLNKNKHLSHPQEKILFAELFPEEDNPHSKQVNTDTHARMLPDVDPGIAHPDRPVNIVEYDDRIVLRMLQALVKIIQGSLFPVIA